MARRRQGEAGGGEQGADPGAGADSETDARAFAYWQRNLRCLAILLSIWLLVSYGFGIVLAEPLNAVRIPGTGFKLGFWFAQQGSIYVFVALIFVYARWMNRLDAEFGVAEE